MKKSDIIIHLTQHHNLTKQQAKDLVETLFNVRSGKGIITNALLSGEKVNISGFGTFAIRKVNSRTIKMPNTNGKEINVPCRQYACFKPGKSLRALLRKI